MKDEDVKQLHIIESKVYYSTYRADDRLSSLSWKLVSEVCKFEPVHVLDYGCGTGKHLDVFRGANICTIGIDISPANCAKAIHKYDLPCIINSDETYLRHLVNVDVCFTCSVLDHIPDPTGIIDELKRICNKAVVIAETQDKVNEHYYPHDYDAIGFTKLDYSWLSPADGATYHIWIWEK
jgi:SAM-dependent methyltransferase